MHSDSTISKLNKVEGTCTHKKYITNALITTLENSGETRSYPAAFPDQRLPHMAEGELTNCKITGIKVVSFFVSSI